jgi:hypothetical protein
LQVTIQANLESRSFFKNQVVSRFKGRHRSFRSTGARSSGSPAIPTGPFPFRRASASSDNNGFSDLFFGHSLAPDFSFFTDLP